MEAWKGSGFGTIVVPFFFGAFLMCGLPLASGIRTVMDHHNSPAIDYVYSGEDAESDYNVLYSPPAREEPGLDPRHNEVWAAVQPKLREIVDKYEMTCHEAGAEFDRKKMEEEIQFCFRPPTTELLRGTDGMDEFDKLQLLVAINNIKRGRTLTELQLQQLRSRLIEPLCQFMHSVIGCFNPRQSRLMEECTNEAESKGLDYSNLFIASACRNNGSRIVAFLERGGMDCADTYVEHGLECIQKNKDLFVARPKSETTLELCTTLGGVHKCLTETIDKCRPEPAEPLHAVFGELKDWTSNTCLKGAASSPVVPRPFQYIFFMFLIILIFS